MKQSSIHTAKATNHASVQKPHPQPFPPRRFSAHIRPSTLVLTLAFHIAFFPQAMPGQVSQKRSKRVYTKVYSTLVVGISNCAALTSRHISGTSTGCLPAFCYSLPSFSSNKASCHAPPSSTWNALCSLSVHHRYAFNCCASFVLCRTNLSKWNKSSEKSCKRKNVKLNIKRFHLNVDNNNNNSNRKKVKRIGFTVPCCAMPCCALLCCANAVKLNKFKL